MESAVFLVELHQKSNNLTAAVEVISLTSSSAKRFALLTFFKNGNWEVTRCTKARTMDQNRLKVMK